MIVCTSPAFPDIAILPDSIRKEALFRTEDYENSYKGNDHFLLECLGVVKNILKAKEKEGNREISKKIL